MNQSDPSAELLAKYKLALSHANMGLWELDFTTDTLSWDEGLQNLYQNKNGNYSAPSEQFYKSIHPEDGKRMRVEIENARLDLIEIDSLFRITISTGEEKHIRTNAIKIRNKKNEVIGLTGVNWDVTNEYMLQDDLKKTKIFLEKIMEAIPDPLFIKDSQHRTIFANRAFEAICGKDKSEFIGKLDSDYLPAEMAALYWTQDNNVLSGNKSFEFEESVADPDGSVRQLMTKKSSFSVSDDEKVIIGVIRDITEIQKIQKSLIEQSKMASLGEMAAGIGHEINNPLMIIQAKSQILQSKLAESSSGELDSLKLANDLQAIEVNSIRIDKIIKSLKSVSRQSNSDTFEEVSIRKLIEEAIEISKERFGQSEVKFNFYYDEIIDYSCRVKVRSSEIIQVLVNLLNNAFDAIKNQVNPSIQINLVLLEATFKIEVVDSGDAIQPEIAAKMMEPFFTTKKTGAGTGLGLSISKQIIKNHNGDFYYDTNSAHTKFVFHLKRSESISNL